MAVKYFHSSLLPNITKLMPNGTIKLMINPLHILSTVCVVYAILNIKRLNPPILIANIIYFKKSKKYFDFLNGKIDIKNYFPILEEAIHLLDNY